MYYNENSFRVRYIETDRMGIVYHANYYVWFDIGRTEFLRSIGFNYSELEKQGLLLPVLETHCVHKKPARFDDMVTVKTGLGMLKGPRISFKYEVYNGRGEMLAYGETFHAFVNGDMKPIILKKVFPDVYEKLYSCLLSDGKDAI